MIYGRDVLKNMDGVSKMIEEHQSYIDALKEKDKELLQKRLYDSLEDRIEGIAQKSDFYMV